MGGIHPTFLLCVSALARKGEAASRGGASAVQDRQGVPGVPVQPHVGLRGQLEAAVLAHDNDSGSGRSGESEPCDSHTFYCLFGLLTVWSPCSKSMLGACCLVCACSVFLNLWSRLGPNESNVPYLRFG